MRLEEIKGIGEAQRVARGVIHDVAAILRPGLTERAVAEQIEAGLVRAGVRVWLHTPYAWFGERTRFAGFHDWEPDALPTERRLGESESFILDAAPFVEGFPADYAYSGTFGDAADHDRMCAALTDIKRRIVSWAREAATGRELFDTVGKAVGDSGFDVVHSLYPAAVLGHVFDGLPGWLQRLPRIGRGFQLPLIAGYAVALARHRLTGARYPLINDSAQDRPLGVFAMEPHIARDGAGAKFESVLVIDGDETRWLDPELFGDTTP